MFDSRVTRSTAQGAARPRLSPSAKAMPRAKAAATGRVTPAAGSAARPLALLLVIVLIAGALVDRLVYWQVLQYGHLSTMARLQQQSLVTIPAMRGIISDAEGNELAMDVTRDAVYAVPREMKDPTGTADLLAPILGLPVKLINGIFSEFPGYAQLAGEVSPATSARIRALHLPGIVLTPQLQRAYPGGQLASQVVGYVKQGTSQGEAGIEAYFNSLLAGRAGIKSVFKDTAGNVIHLSSSLPTLPQGGGDIELSIDGRLQSLTEHELQLAIQKTGAVGGQIILMDPSTGYISAMAGAPDFDPNSYGRYAYSTFLNPSVQTQYEPGSTFKVITMAAGLDAHVITPQSAFYDTGSFSVGGVTLKNWTGGAFGWETMTQVLQHSANVGAAHVSELLGRNRFFRYVKAFGFGQPTGISLPGELPGQVLLPGQRGWTIVNQFTNAYGQGIDVTPLQLITAVCAVANGGELMRPQIVKQITYQGRVDMTQPVPVRRVISLQAAQTLTDMLVHSAINGEASQALVPGYNIAAKTGTANIAAPSGGYLTGVGSTVASIVGYAPAYHPRVAALVILDRPRSSQWGSQTAAPVLHNLFKELFDYYHIPPSPHALYQ